MRTNGQHFVARRSEPLPWVVERWRDVAHRKLFGRGYYAIWLKDNEIHYVKPRVLLAFLPRPTLTVAFHVDEEGTAIEVEATDTRQGDRKWLCQFENELVAGRFLPY